MAKEIKRGGAGERKSENGSNPYFNLDAEKAFFDEVDEEVRNEKFKELVNKYGGFILAVVIAGLAFAVGYEKVGEWRVSKAEQSNIRYVQAVTPGTDYENNIAELESIVNTESGLYKDIARLQIANILLDNNQTTKALDVLSKIYQDNTVSEKIREIAAVKLATYKIDSASYAEIESMLGPIVRKGGAWAPMAKELLAMSAIQNKDMAKAKALYEELLAGGNISEEFRARINDMLASINEAQQDNFMKKVEEPCYVLTLKIVQRLLRLVREKFCKLLSLLKI